MDQQNTSDSSIKQAVAGKRNALGRGLSALMSVTAVSVKPAHDNHSESGAVPEARAEQLQTNTAVFQPNPGINDLFYLSISELQANPNQPRREFTTNELNELSESIKKSGLIQPIVVRKTATHYEIVAGERRFRAAKMAGLNEIPVILKELSDRDTLALGIVENVQRQDLNPIDEALAYQRLIEDFEETQSSVSQLVGKDRASIANALRLLKLQPKIREMLVGGKISAGHGRALLAIGDSEEQFSLAEKIVREGLSVRTIEKLVGTAKNDETSDNKNFQKLKLEKISQSENLNRLQIEISERVRRALGTKVIVNLNSEERGEVTISFFSRDELESLLERFESQVS